MEAILFDFDLTLADTRVAIMRCFAHGCRVLGYPVPSERQVLGLVGRPLAEMWERLQGDRAAGDADRFVAAYRSRATVHMTSETRLFPAARETLDALGAAGWRLGIVSTKIRVRIEEVLEHHRIAERFEVLLGGDDVPRHKPDPAGIMMALGRLGVDRASAVYVGDSLTDARTARAAGIDFIAITSGETPAAAFAEHAPRAVLKRLSQLPAALGPGPAQFPFASIVAGS